MHFSIYYVFYSLFSHNNVSVTIAAILMVVILLKEYNDRNEVSCVAVTP
jgi:hypothetical protein